MYEFLEKPTHCGDCDIAYGICDTTTEYCKKDMIKAYQQGKADAEKELQGIEMLGALYSEIRNDAIDEFANQLPYEYCNYCNQIACDGGRIGSIQECASVTMLVDVLKDLAEQLKENKNEV